MTRQVFISYSHQDRRWRDRLVIALKPSPEPTKISYFDDTQLHPGEHWWSTLDREIGRPNVAVLLVSANFLQRITEPICSYHHSGTHSAEPLRLGKQTLCQLSYSRSVSRSVAASA